MPTFQERIIGAASLDPVTYAQIEADPDALGPAMGLVVLSSVAAAVGAMGTHESALLSRILIELVEWFICAGLLFLVGTRILPGSKKAVDPRQFMRTVGFAAAPGIVRILGVMPVLGPFIAFGAAVWMLLAMIVAVREVLDYSSAERTMAACAGPIVVYVAMKIFIGA